MITSTQKKSFGLLILVVALVLSVVVLMMKKTDTHLVPPLESFTPEASSSPTSKKCEPSDLRAKVIFDGAAGSINGNFTLENVSDHTCTLVGKNQFRLQYDPMITSIIVVPDQLIADKTYSLTPHAVLVALSRVQNGPQCSTKTVAVDVSYVLDLENDQNVIFTDADGIQNFPINVCELPKEVTKATISSFALSLPD